MENLEQKNQYEDNRLDELLDMLLSGNASGWESLNRLEQYLICILTHQGIEELGKPLNRLEVLLQVLYEVVPGTSGGSSELLEVIAARLEELK